MYSCKNILYLVVFSVLLANCSEEAEKRGSAPYSIIYSPNAEPLNGGSLGRLTCQAALTHWFDRIDSNHDGSIGHSEFIADAKAQFFRMDIDKNGYLVSEEIERYRAPYRQEPAARKTSGSERSLSQNARGERHKRVKEDGGEKYTDPADLIDPVMSADSNLDFKVTLGEFLAQAEKNFSELDSDHTNSLSRKEVLALCDKNKNTP